MNGNGNKEKNSAPAKNQTFIIQQTVTLLIDCQKSRLLFN